VVEQREWVGGTEDTAETLGQLVQECAGLCTDDLELHGLAFQLNGADLEVDLTGSGRSERTSS
jgi:hypothetical protein